MRYESIGRHSRCVDPFKEFKTARAIVQEVRLDFIHTTNVQNLSYCLKVNEFAGLTTSEFASRYTGA